MNENSNSAAPLVTGFKFWDFLYTWENPALPTEIRGKCHAYPYMLFLNFEMLSWNPICQHIFGIKLNSANIFS